MYSLLMKAVLYVLFFVACFAYAPQTYAQNRKEIAALEASLDKTLGNEKIDLLIKIGWEYRNDDLSKSLQYLEEAASLAQKSDYQKALSEAINMTGVVHRKLGNYNKAMDYFFQSLEISEKLNDSTQTAYAFNNMGEVYTYQLDYKNAEIYIKKALAIFSKQNNKKGIAYCYLRLGENAEAQNLYRPALKYYLTCANIRKNTLNDERGLATVFANITNIYYKLGQQPKALEYAQEALKLLDQNDKSGIAQTNISIAKIYLKQAQLDQAEAFAQSSLYLAKSFNSKKITQEASLLLAEIYAQQGKITEAFELQQLSMRLKDSLFAEEANRSINNLRESYESEKKQLQINTLSKIQKIQQEENELKTLLLYGSLVALCIISITLLLLYRNYRQNQRMNHLLSEQKEEISGIAENLKKANFEISKQHEIIERKNKDLTSSINYAQRIQQAMLPSDKMLNNALPEHFVFFKPKDIVSGDFYWVSQKKYKTILAVADCTGHGIPGAFMSLIGNDLLNEIVLGRNINEPDKILQELRRLVRIVLRQEETNNHDGMDITIVAFDRYPEEHKHLLGTPKLEFAGAENPLYYFSKGELHEVKGSKAMIGGFNILERENSFQKFTLELTPEVFPLTFYLFSDGYQDQFGEKGKIMKRRFRELLKETHTLAMPEQYKALENYFDQWKGTHTQMDDILVMGVRLDK